MFSLLGIFSGPYALLARWAVLGIACAALFGYGWVKGDQHGTEKLTNYQAQQALEAARIVVKQGEVTEKIRTQYVDRVKTVKEVGDEVVKVVPVYITQKDDAACFVNNGARIVHDSAALNKVPPPPSGTDAAASGLTLSHTLRTVARNYQTYHEDAARLTALQAWIREQYKATNGEELK